MEQSTINAMNKFVEHFLELYLSVQDFEKLKPFLATDFTLSGISHGRESMYETTGSQLCETVLNAFSAPIRYVIQKQHIKPMDYNQAMVILSLETIATLRGIEQPSQNMQLTLWVFKGEEQWYINHMHQSILSDHNNRHHLAQMAIDQLTGLYANWKFSEILEDFLNQNKRYYVQAVLMMIDVDHFTEINDTLGEPAGDRILGEMALIIKKRLRTTDYIGRWEGEKFIVLMPHTSYRDGLNTAESIRRMIAHTNFGLHRSLTISIGIVGTETVESVDHWIGEANRYLMDAKLQGRNRVVGQEEPT